jgi:hypothetical protein
MGSIDNRIISDAKSKIIICTMRHVLGFKKRKAGCVRLVVDFLLPSHAICGNEAVPAGTQMPCSI